MKVFWHTGEVFGGAKLGIISTAQLLPIGRPPTRVHSGETVATGHVVYRMSMRCTQADVIESIAADPGQWLEELFGRTLVEGTNAGSLCRLFKSIDSYRNRVCRHAAISALI